MQKGAIIERIPVKGGLGYVCYHCLTIKNVGIKMATNVNYGEFVKENIIKAGNFIIRKADDILEDMYSERITGITISINLDAMEIPTVSVTKHYLPTDEVKDYCDLDGDCS